MYQTICLSRRKEQVSNKKLLNTLFLNLILYPTVSFGHVIAQVCWMSNPEVMMKNIQNDLQGCNISPDKQLPESESVVSVSIWKVYIFKSLNLLLWHSGNRHREKTISRWACPFSLSPPASQQQHSTSVNQNQRRDTRCSAETRGGLHIRGLPQLRRRHLERPRPDKWDKMTDEVNVCWPC